MRYPLVIPQGNFGSIEGDSPAAYRYTECKLAEISEDLLSDIDCDTVDFMPNYKETISEPTVLPSALPTLLMNGSTGIAVGMTTNIPPHNLDELIDGICMLIDNPSVPMAQLMEVIKGPDFPTGGVIVGKTGIENYMKTGRGIVKMRGVASVEELKNGKEQIVITEIPYNVNRNTLVENIAQLVSDKVLTEVSDIRNESDENTRVVIELKRGEAPRVVMNKLFKHTALESSFGVIMLALDKRKPKQMNMKEMLECYIEHPPRSHLSPHQIPPAQGGRQGAYPRRIQNRAQQPRRFHQNHKGVERQRGSPHCLDGKISAFGKAGKRHSRLAPAPAHRSRTRENRKRIYGVDETHRRIPLNPRKREKTSRGY